MTDLYGVPEFFVSGLMKVCLLSGDCVRFIFYREHEDGEKEPVLSVIAPVGMTAPAIDQIICKVGVRAAGAPAQKLLA